MGEKVLLFSAPMGTPLWYPAEVARIEANGVRVVAVAGDKRDVLAREGDIVKITDRYSIHLNEYLTGLDFLTESSKHGLAPLDGYTPQVGDEVLAHKFTNMVMQEKVHYVLTTRQTVTTRDGGTNTTTPVIRVSEGSDSSAYNYVPLSALDNPPPVSVGQFVVVKPDEGMIWPYAKVTAVNGDQLEVSVNGVTARTVRKGEYYPLLRDQPGR